MYLLKHLHPFLQRQQLEYGIYVIHQVSVGTGQGSASDSPASDGVDHLSFLVNRNVKLLSKERSFTLFTLEMSKGNFKLRVGSNGT